MSLEIMTPQQIREFRRKDTEKKHSELLRLIHRNLQAGENSVTISKSEFALVDIDGILGDFQDKGWKTIKIIEGNHLILSFNEH